jgi:hypothetical protein
VPRPRNHHKRTAAVLLEDLWSLRVTHSDTRATVTHIHMLDRLAVETTHPPRSADCCVTEALCYLANTARHDHEVSVRFCRNVLWVQEYGTTNGNGCDQCMPAL